MFEVNPQGSMHQLRDEGLGCILAPKSHYPGKAYWPQYVVYRSVDPKPKTLNLKR